ncbi:ATP-grasp domain-containing protein [Streptomyces sp. SKN60]|uniref:ATP-grasp domain-containing protein n=1 Tax=Streptomyces sp. SKN60 TaxID=2855506 RepID=UPI002245A347|nr:ATP-grasp domain-containing protein [Streptomyces sp. SKN60]MCX2182271.1 ATP-grasp domain-containing protein [Streptomyces sp. SKN60]
MAEPYGGCVFIVDPEEPDAIALLPVLEELGTVVTANTLEACVELLADVTPRGVVVFDERSIRLAAGLAEYYDLPGVSPKAAQWLCDKSAQRERLNACGIGDVRSVSMTGGEVPAEIPLPAVVKPSAGAGSEDTFIVRTREEFDVVAAGLDPARAYVVEHYIEGADAPLGSWLADYVSVESAVDAAGTVRHIGITGRLPLARPARETGLVFPVKPDAELEESLLGLAEATISALEFRAGLAHTEIKIGTGGPVVIELNGRLGGGLHRLMPQAGGVEPVSVAVALATGEPVPDGFPEPARHALHYYVQPPCEATAVLELPTPRVVKTAPGVFQADRTARPGASVDWRRGSTGRVYDVWLVADSLPELASHQAGLDEVLERTIRWESA